MYEERPDDASAGARPSSTGQGARDLIERVFLLGVGAAALSVERIQEAMEDLVRRGNLTSDEGREMVDRLVARSRDEARTAMKRADSSLQGAYRDMGLVSKRELEDLDFRLRQLEHRIQLLEVAADGRSSAGGTSPVT